MVISLMINYQMIGLTNDNITIHHCFYSWVRHHTPVDMASKENKVRQRITLMLPYLQFIIALITLYRLDHTITYCR